MKRALRGEEDKIVQESESPVAGPCLVLVERTGVVEIADVSVMDLLDCPDLFRAWVPLEVERLRLVRVSDGCRVLDGRRASRNGRCGARDVGGRGSDRCWWCRGNDGNRDRSRSGRSGDRGWRRVPFQLLFDHLETGRGSVEHALEPVLANEQVGPPLLQVGERQLARLELRSEFGQACRRRSRAQVRQMSRRS